MKNKDNNKEAAFFEESSRRAASVSDAALMTGNLQEAESWAQQSQSESDKANDFRRKG